MMQALPRAWFGRDPLEVAPELLGCTLAVRGVGLRITEVEAYRGESDPGSHGFRGRTPRTAVMFGPPGHLYVYFTYGMHWCANLVCASDGVCGAVLVRAGEVVDGLELALERRPGVRDRDLARGPARLTRALGITGEDDGADVCGGDDAPFAVLPPTAPVDPARVRSGPRVGVSGAGGDGVLYPWRYWLDGEPSVSPYRAAKPRVRRR